MKNTFKISKQQITYLCELLGDNERFFKENFPEAFEPELKTGIWYKSNNKASRMFVFLKSHENYIYKGYGFDYYGLWSCLDVCPVNFFKNQSTPATEEEVFERLKEEAVKRGFKKGVTVDRSNIIKTGEKLNGNIGKLDFNEFEYGKFNDNCLSCLNTVIYANGVWAEICITKEEAEKELGKKII